LVISTVCVVFLTFLPTHTFVIKMKEAVVLAGSPVVAAHATLAPLPVVGGGKM
jgi:hypothetical protein